MLKFRQLRSTPLNTVVSKDNSFRNYMIGDGRMNEQTQTVTIESSKQNPPGRINIIQLNQLIYIYNN